MRPNIASRTDNARIDDELANKCLAFKAYPIRAEVASISIAFEPKIFCDILYDQIAMSKFPGAIGSTTANPHNPDFEIFTNPQDPDC